ncbi:MAG TPA: exodeoxyribonuclease VII large subunit [Candidatus Eisenbacteria bacterium]|nr:exodeoxyribonuclease VII large subunit [Candidatus Eisenbacteria bacterium]
MARVHEKQAELPLFAAPAPRCLTISQLSQIIKTTLEARLGGFWVVGEVSNCRIPPSGHCYFTLKDERSQICAVMFRRPGSSLPFVPENGMKILCFGRVSLYGARGDLQFYVELMEPRGQGALFVAFEQLKRRLSGEGLFASERKRPLPFLPASIGIVTSVKGAALRDMLRILGDRFPARRIVVRPVRVQGPGASEEIARAIGELGRSGLVEVMIVGRGGGSLEDLWAFNDEIVARAIYRSPVPVISAVGHEIDVTIADFVADRRAPTPTAAAEMVVPRAADLEAQLQVFETRLARAMQARLAGAQDALRRLARRLADPRRRVREYQQRLDEAALDLLRRFRERLRRDRDRLAHVSGRLHALSPLAVLDRGYSIAHRLPENKIVRDASEIAVGERLRITFARGRSVCRVEEKE